MSPSNHYLVGLVAASAAAATLLSDRAGAQATSAPDVRQEAAPTGRLRVGLYPGSPTSMTRDRATGETRGLGFDLGQEFARHLNVPFEPVEFPQIANVLQALKQGQVDFTVTNSTPARAQDMDSTSPILGIELGFLVSAGSPIATQSDVDRPGMRVGVTAGGSSHSTLSREFKHAAVIPAQTLSIAIEMLSGRQIDAYATNKAVLFEMSNQLSGSHVLDGRWGVELFAIAIPKGRAQALAAARQFALDAQSKGLVKRAADRAGLRGTVETK